MPLSQLPILHEQDLWVGLTTVVMVSAVGGVGFRPVELPNPQGVVRSIQHWNKTTQEVQFYITSLVSDPNKIGSAIRQHWGIENSAHWTLDVTFHVREAALKEQMSPEFVLCTVHRILLYYVVLLSML